MRKVLLCFVCITTLLFFVSYTNANKQQNGHIIISGRVLKMGEQPSSESKWIFRLVKYSVQDVCEGDYEEREILISHLPGPELNDLNIGDEVCVVVGKSEGPTINHDWTFDFQGKQIHYINDGLFIKNCKCYK